VNRSDAISLILQAASHIGAHASDTNKADMCHGFGSFPE
jgi:hypothetical protein